MTRSKSQWRGTGKRIVDATGTYAANQEERRTDPSQKRWRVFLGPQNITTIFSAQELCDLEDLVVQVNDYEDEQEAS